MNRDKVKRILGLVVEPIALGLLALLFIIPSITVVNLQPLTKTLQQFNVLGVSSYSDLQINVVGGSHQIFRSESLVEENGGYVYETKLLKRESDNYSKPILEIINNKEEEVNLEVYGGTDIPTGSDIGLIINDQMYRVQNQRGDMARQRITLLPGEKQVVFLTVESFSNVQFEEDFTLNIKEI